MWKRGVGFAVCSAMVVAAFPAFSDSVPAKEAKNAAGVSREAGTELMKAGSLPATEDTKTAAQPFSTWTGGSYSFRIPCFISLEHGVHRGNLVAAADARYTTPGGGGAGSNDKETAGAEDDFNGAGESTEEGDESGGDSGPECTCQKKCTASA